MLKRILKAAGIIGTIAMFGAIAFFLILKGPLEDLDAAKERHIQLREEYLSAYKYSVNLELYRQRLAEMQKLQRTTRTMLPDADGVEVTWQELQDSIRAEAAKTRLESSLELSIGNSGHREFYAYCPFSLRVSGEFKDVVRFLQRISTASAQLRMLKHVSLRPRLPGGGITLSVEAYAFAHLSDETVAALRAKARNQAKTPR
jgi:Tfp pilus assembly protein PilO